MSIQTKQPDDPSTPAPSADRTSQTPRYFMLAGMALIFAAVCVAYFPALQGQFIWDDNAHVTKPELRSLTGLYRIWFDVGATQQYYPLLHSAFWLEYQLWGDHPLGYHLLNLLLHSAAATLVYLILRKLQIPGALLAAAIFALHPVQVESVAWITEQKNTLSAVFYLSAMLVYLQFDQTRQPSLYATALALFILGLLSKTVTATLPAALLVIFWWQRGGLSWQRDVKPLIPFFLLGAIAGLFTAWVERNLIGAEGAPFELSIVQRGLLAGRVIWFYLGNLIWPANLVFVYPRWDVEPSVGWQWLFPLAALAVLIALWLIRRRWRGPLAGWLFFVGTLFPVLGFFNVFPFMYSFVADHFQYLASLGLIVLAATAMALGISRLPLQVRWIGNLLCVALVTVLATRTWQQTQIYSDVMTLWQTTIDRNPVCWLAYNNLGVQFAGSSRDREAIEHYRQSLQLKPDYAEAHFNLANALFRAGQQQQAIEQYQQALRFRPGYLEARNNLGGILTKAGRLQEAIEQLQQALQFNPAYADAHNNLGIALRATGQKREAIEHFAQALRLKPDNAATHRNLGDALMDFGQPEYAVQHFQQALRLDPQNVEAQFNLGVALAKAGRIQEAIEQFKETLRLHPDSVDTYANLTMAYAQLHRSADAIATAQKAMALARSTGKTDLAEQIEAWLTNYRASQSNSSDPVARPEVTPVEP